jgi:hypothetical protein
MALATPHLTAGTATFGLALPEGQATGGVRVVDSSFITLNTQTDVKNIWDDGSIRFAVVSAVIPLSGNYTIEAGSVTSGTFTPTWPTASVALVIGGTTYTATLPARTTTDPWLVGPHVQEHRVVVTPLNGATPHVLRVFFDVRSYQQGGHRVDVSVKNVLDHADTNSFTYDVTVTINGSAVFTRSSKLHKTTTLWRRTFETGSPTLSTVTPDFEPFHTSYAIPRYDASIVNSTWPGSGSLADARYDILGYGDMSEGMGSPGGRNELAPFPNWAAQYVVHKDADAFAYMIRAAEQSGSWSGHITNPDGTSIKREGGDTGYWLDGQDRGGSMDIPTDPLNFNFIRGWGEALEINHIPQLTLIPYLVTGDRFFADQMRLWAHATILMEYQGDGWHAYGIGSGPMWTLLYSHQVRGIAWGLRTIAEAAAFLPDGDADKTYFENAVTENLTHLEWVATTLDPGGPLGVPFVSPATSGALKLAVVSWQNDYVLYAIDRANALGFAGASSMRTKLATWRVRLLTTADGWDRAYGAPYWMPFPSEDGGVGAQTGAGNTPSQGGGTPTIPSGVGRTWLTMGQIFAQNMQGPGDIPNVNGPYGGDAKLGLRVAVQMGLAGAQAAFDYLDPIAASVHPGWDLVGVNGSEDPPPPEPPPSTTPYRFRFRFRA